MEDFGVSVPSAEELGEAYFGNKVDKWLKNPDSARRLENGRDNERQPPVHRYNEDSLSSYAAAKEIKEENRRRNIAGSGIFQTPDFR